MAYSSTITYLHKRNGVIVVRVVELEAAAASETDAITVFKRGRIIRYDAELVSGSGATIDPEGGRKAGWTASTIDEVFADSTAAPAAHVSEDDPVPYHSPDGEIYLRSGVDAGADNKIVTELIIVGEVD